MVIHQTLHDGEKGIVSLFKIQYVLLFSWPPACAVWQNYKVTMFQSWSGNDPILRSISNGVSSLFLLGRQRFSISLTITWRVPTSFTSSTLRLSNIDLFAPNYSSSIPVLYRLFTQAFTPAGLHCPSLRLMSCHPSYALQVPLGPCSPASQARLCCLIPRPVAPILPSLTSLASLLTPVRTIFKVSSFLHHSSNPTPPPWRPWPESWSLLFPREVMSPVLGFLSYPVTLVGLYGYSLNPL